MKTSLGFFFTIALVAACKTSATDEVGDDDAGIGADDRGDALAARAAFRDAYCALVAPCCEAAGREASECEAWVDRVVPETFDRATGELCLASVRSHGAKPDFCSHDALLTLDEACVNLSSIAGTVPLGGSCSNSTTNIECARSPDGQVGCVSGKCQLQAIGHEGDTGCIDDTTEEGLVPKGGNDNGLTGTLYCDRRADLFCNTSGTCVKRGAAGASCRYESDCLDGHFCNDAGTCQEHAPAGSPCPTYDGCAVGTYCEASSNTCTALAEDGSPCKARGECLSNVCLPSGRCARAFAPSANGLICAP